MRNLFWIFIFSLLTGCVTQSVKKDMSAFTTAAPRSILVVPVVNKSLDVDAPNYVLATLPISLADKGYYVFPVNTTKFVLEQEGFYEGDRIHNEPPSALAKLFDADAILYVTIHRWDAKYAIFATTVTVEFEYRMVSKDGTDIWSEKQKMAYTPQSNSSGSALGSIISAVVSAAISRATPNYMPLTQQANREVFLLSPNALPDGPYKTAKIN
ncbi:MAG: GNA1162 family protein [Bdellovibrionia bacterium]